MIHLKILLAFFLAFTFSNIVHADASTGEFFGYQISESYPVTKKTRIKSESGGVILAIKAEFPKKPADVGKVYVITTTMTHTIGKIYSTRKFRNAEVANKFADRYAAFLAAKYRKHSPQMKGLADSSKLLINFDNNYELRVKVFTPEPIKTKSGVVKEIKPSVEIGLNIHGEGKKKHLVLIDKEHDQLLIKNAETKGRDTGL